jgi:Bacterial Ig domain
MVVRRRAQSVVGLAGLMLLIVMVHESVAARAADASSSRMACSQVASCNVAVVGNSHASAYQLANAPGAYDSSRSLMKCDPLSIVAAAGHPATIQLHCLSPLNFRPTFAIITEPLHGTLSLTASTGEASYTPTGGYSGPDSFTYDATSRLGTAVPATVSITVGGTAASVPPVLAKVAQSHSIWREGTRLATVSRKRVPVGTTFSFRLNEQASVRFAFTQQVAGRKVKGKCVARTRKNRGKHSCKRALTRGTLSLTGHSGLNRVAFQGRVSRSLRLGLGRYTLRITASNSAEGRSSARALYFTIVR